MDTDLSLSPDPALRSPGELSSGLASLIASYDWSATPLGPRASWPPSLNTLLSVILGSNQPMFVAWGPQQTLIYNDAYAGILMNKHPAALGRPFLEVWSEIRADLLPIVEEAYAGRPVHMSDITLVMNRRGFPEEAHFAFSYTPLFDPGGGVEGFFCACMEITAQVMAERRLIDERTRLLHAFEQAPAFMIVMAGPDHRVEFVNASHRAIFGSGEWVGKTIREAFPDIADQGFFEVLDRVYATGERFVAMDAVVRYRTPGSSTPQDRILDFIYEALRDDQGQVFGILCEGLDVTHRHEAEAHRQLLIDELNHRVKNTLAVVQGLAQQTFRRASSQGDAVAAFEARLVALAAAHSVLTEESWRSAELGQIVGAMVAAHDASGARFECTGPTVYVDPKVSVSLSMTLHELATNATKYGALSVESGRVLIEWSLAEEGVGPVRLEWREVGGPSVTPPQRKGFGSRLIESSLAGDLGSVVLEFLPDGVVCQITAPVMSGPSEAPAFLRLNRRRAG